MSTQKVSVSLRQCVVLAPGVVEAADREVWAKTAPACPDALPDVPLVYKKRLPMMKARRMSAGSRLAAEAALALEDLSTIDAWVFSSRHGETVRGVKIIDAIAAGGPASPTDFMMSVHNAAAGMFTIEGHVTAAVASIAAGEASFHMALIEAAGMLSDDCRTVAVVDFDEKQNPALLDAFDERPTDLVYATAWVLTRGDELTFTVGEDPTAELKLPLSLQLAAALARGDATFTTTVAGTAFHWERR